MNDTKIICPNCGVQFQGSINEGHGLYRAVCSKCGRDDFMYIDEYVESLHALFNNYNLKEVEIDTVYGTDKLFSVIFVTPDNYIWEYLYDDDSNFISLNYVGRETE